MGKDHADQIKFREYVVELVKHGRWATIAGETEPDLARRLGVTLDVLEQANRERDEQLNDGGKTGRRLGHGGGRAVDYAVLGVTMPPQVFARWIQFCQLVGVDPACVLRSLIHHFLLTGTRPKTTGGAWLLHSTYYSISAKGRRGAKARVTRGVQDAVDRYADRWNVTATGIVRGLIVDTLEANALPKGCRLVACAALWDDAAKYLELARPD
jgi:hypothetical protein